MKGFIPFLIMCGFFCSHYQVVNAQVKDPVKQTEKEGERRVNRGIDRTIDRGFDKLEEGIGGLFKKKKKDNNDKDEATKDEGQASAAKQADAAGSSAGESSGLALNWAKYDFVPGDQVIFEDDQAGEENGEFPSRWDLVRGNTEIAVVDGENVIMMRDGAPSIVPYIKDSQNDYLPDIFTIELDLYYPGDGSFQIYLYDRKNQKSDSPTGYTYLQVNYNQFLMGEARSRHPEENLAKERWMHIAIAYTDGKLKAYMDETRLINIPRLDFNPKGLTLYSYHARNDNLYYIKNVRIAQGGVKYI